MTEPLGVSTTASRAYTRGRVTERAVLLVASFGAFLAFLDATIVNVAFPSIQESFPETSISGLSWVLNAYNIVFASFLVVFGRLADLLGRRRGYLLGIALFTVASALCAAAPSVGFLVAARAFQALGAAMLVPASLALVVESFPAGRRAHAVGLWGASAAVAAGLGPPIGGALVELGDWRWAFLVNLPFGVAAILTARSQLVESRAPGRRRMPDLRGACLFAAALGLLTLGIVKGNDWGWASPEVIGSFALAVTFIVVFVFTSRRHRSPLLDPALLRIRPFAVANLVTVVAGAGFYAYLLTNILWLQYVWGWSVLEAGLALVPAALVAAVVAAVLGPVASARGYRLIVLPGAIVWSLAYVWYATRVGLQPDFIGEWLPGQLLSGVGVGATLPVLGSAALAAVPGGRYATASAVVSSARQLGGVLGISILVVIIGTPTAAAAADALRPGWVFSAVCFALCAAGVLMLGRPDPDAAMSIDQELSQGPAVHATQLSEAEDEQADGAAVVGNIPLLSRLPGPTRTRLEAVAVDRQIAAGDWLFRSGDPGSAMYVVRSGRLEVVVDGLVVRELGAGDVIGELALLTGDVRSAAVRARRDSRLLELTNTQFDHAMSDDAGALRGLATVLAERLRDTSPAPAEGRRSPDVISVVGLHPGAPVEAVTHQLVAAISEHLRVIAPGVLTPEALEYAERDHDRVILHVGLDSPDADDQMAWRDFCLRQADLVILVAISTEPVPPAARRLGVPTGADLVLVGDPPPASGQLSDWSAALEPWQVTVAAPGDLVSRLRPLAARIAGRSVGLALAGGGARAFAHIGVLQELADAGVHVDRVAGCSVGAIIAALHAYGHDGVTVQEICYDEFVRRRPFSDYTVPRASLAQGRRLRVGLARRFGDALIEALPRQFRCVSTDLLARTSHIHRRGSLAESVNASVSLPVLFPPVRLDDRLLIDGGILDNLPYSLLTERAEGPVLAVNIATRDSAGRPGRQGPPRIPALGETLLRIMLMGSGGAVERARAHGVSVVTPAPMGVGLLEFHQLDRVVESGRAAGRALLEQAGDQLQRPLGR
ncbi:MAG: MFS transporter [Candidatus Nanopelagicales bacterium]